MQLTFPVLFNPDLVGFLYITLLEISIRKFFHNFLSVLQLFKTHHLHHSPATNLNWNNCGIVLPSLDVFHQAQILGSLSFLAICIVGFKADCQLYDENCSSDVQPYNYVWSVEVIWLRKWYDVSRSAVIWRLDEKNKAIDERMISWRWL